MAAAFSDDFTRAHGGRCFFVDVNDAATVIARVRPEADRQPFVQQLVDKARTAVPPQPEQPAGDDADEHEQRNPVETDEHRQAKRAVVADLVASLDGVRLEATDKEFEGLANLVLSLVLALYPATDAEYPALVRNLAAALSRVNPDKPQQANPSLSARYSALATLFNALPLADPTSNALRLDLLLQLVAFAATNDDLAVVAPALDKLEQWLADWGFGPGSDGEERGHEAVQHVVDALVAKGAAADATRARALLLAHLAASPSTSSASSPSSSSPAAAGLASTLVALSLAAPDVYDFHALTPARYPALAALPAPLAALLSTFQQPASSSSSASASSSTPSVPTDALESVPAVPLDQAQLEKKLHLSRLAELCSGRVGQSVAYAEVAQAVGISAQGDDATEDVETWVIDAIRASLLQGRLSQPTQTLHVSRASPVQAFTTEHWHVVHQRLEGWADSLRRIRSSVDRGLGAGAGAGQGAQEVVGAAGKKDDEAQQ
ncbi:PCI domain-containing protein [Rhodotorula paludigena]|uniref:PCI domain-containing protein n=1 Tax=Rhodotorula paludigena TaxID=86838 RepID=UPI0031800D20